ncbi:MAG: tRNA (N(6)-L-threonylcarbamoyladenosine(37)-C(2))-methylthiotransferase MtaB [Pseudomonadota bacterium]|nr:tRNA (N(6)-L-threonylcarbamoyladenosine(37)-C(2))-methylthiotransferase MtaB [Pseudomonadota bacterium]
MKVKCVTLGCKLNYYESCALGEEMERRGYQVVHDGSADIVIVNTCAVTSKAGMQSRQEVRKAIKNNPGARVVMTGCYAQFNPGIADNIENLAAIVGNAGKAFIPHWISDNEQLDPEVVGPENFGFSGCMPVDALKARSFMGRSRAFLKIQDGCNAFCHYCIIPFLRGRSRSLETAEIVAEAKAIADVGYRELVLTGVHLGQYGQDLNSECDLTFLLEQLLQESRLRVRLGSLQPQEVTPTMINLLADEGNNLCEHLHLSLQSADDQVLASMGRPYGQKEIIYLAKTIKQLNPRITVGADIIVGYPTETEEAFKNTLHLLSELPFTYLHVFPYSPRAGTVAAKMKDTVPVKLKKERVKILQKLEKAKKTVSYNEYINQPLRVIMERVHKSKEASTSLSGHSRNYLNVSINDFINHEPSTLLNREIKVLPHAFDGLKLLAKIDRRS